eukprot:GFUD01008383.1.p1 GENE.GFUD01008383.1~~GFUD01008383.1.p1  ORF type:complete len:169 (+),score=47.27 GFUD01008383.1:361-867(+)
MPALQQYVLVPINTGDYDEKTIADICKVIETVLFSLSDLETFPAVVKRKMTEKYGKVSIGVAGIGINRKIKNYYIRIGGVRGGENMVEIHGHWLKLKEGMKKENLTDNEKKTLLPYDHVLMVMAKIQGVRPLQDLAAYQVAKSHGTNLEMLQIPNLLKEVVSKFNFEH